MTMNDTPKVGEPCKADPYVEGEFLHGVITRIDPDTCLVYAKLDGHEDFCGDAPTQKDDNGFWIFDSF